MEMELWRRVWRLGLAPHLSETGLHALRAALLHNDDRLLQGASTSPPALDVLAECEVEAACALCYCAWRGDGCTSVGEVAREFERLCLAADQALGEPGGVRAFLDWYDLTPRGEVRRLLREEVEHALAQRRSAAA